jgi:DNA-binding FrmR family transcriptional regulator
MDKTDKLKRLKNIEGHVRGIERMVEDDSYCIDLIRQIQAVQAALAKLSSSILDDHIHSCLITAVRGEDPAANACGRRSQGLSARAWRRRRIIMEQSSGANISMRSLRPHHQTS